MADLRKLRSHLTALERACRQGKLRLSQVLHRAFVHGYNTGAADQRERIAAQVKIKESDHMSAHINE